MGGVDETSAVTDLAQAVARAIRSAVLPFAGHRTAREVVGTAASGDVTFQIDRVAETALQEYLQRTDARVAYYSEDKGLVEVAPSPDWLLIVDPIDGTRPAAVGFEQACVSVAVCPCLETPRLRDVQAGCVIEIQSGRCFTAERGRGARLDGRPCLVPTRATGEDLGEVFWGFELVGRPAKRVIDVLGPLIDRSSVRAGVFVFNSSSYALTRLTTGQLDAYLDVGGWILAQRPESRADFLAAGQGRVLGLFPYDIAAAVLIVQEAGGVVTDADGTDLGLVPVLDTTEQNVLSCAASATPAVHQALVAYVKDSVVGSR